MEPEQPVTEASTSLWKPGYVWVEFNNNKRERRTGLILGGLTVSRDPNGLCRLGSSTTALMLCTVAQEAEALKIGEFLHARCAAALARTTPQEVNDHLPLWVKPWIRACRRANGWVNPVPYLSGEIQE